MSRNFTSLALSASLLLMSSAALAEPIDPVCALVDDSMRAAWQLTDVVPVVEKKSVPKAGGGMQDMVSCTWTSKTDGRSLVVMSMVVAELRPGSSPTSCKAQPMVIPFAGSMTMTMCMAPAAGGLLTVMLTQKGDSDPKVSDTLRTHTETMVAKLGKTAK